MLRTQLVRLERRKNQLTRTGTPLPELNRTTLAPRLVEFELRKAEIATPPWMIDRTTLATLLSGVLEIGKAVAEFTPTDLIELHRQAHPGDTGLTRAEPNRRQSVKRPDGPPPQRIPQALDRFFEWVGCQGFADLHPVEQMSLAQTRLLEIDPFRHASDSTITLFCCRFALAAGYPLPTPDPPEAPQFLAALEASWSFSTHELVEFNLRAIERSYERIAPSPA